MADPLDFPNVGTALAPPVKPRTLSTPGASSSLAAQGQSVAAAVASSPSTQQASASAEVAIEERDLPFIRKLPPKDPIVPHTELPRLLGETDQEYKCWA
ncbi:MAG: hypothetical protein ACKPKO_26925, partial [Candidatus Fonsibacter sp.]